MDESLESCRFDILHTNLTQILEEISRCLKSYILVTLSARGPKNMPSKTDEVMASTSLWAWGDECGAQVRAKVLYLDSGTVGKLEPDVGPLLVVVKLTWHLHLEIIFKNIIRSRANS